MNNINYTNATAIVETNYGLIKGILTMSLLNNIFYSFHGIPYATPPLGELRFKVSFSELAYSVKFFLIFKNSRVVLIKIIHNNL